MFRNMNYYSLFPHIIESNQGRGCIAVMTEKISIISGISYRLLYSKNCEIIKLSN